MIEPNESTISDPSAGYSDNNPERKPRAEEVFDKEILEKWGKEQIDLRQKLELHDTEPWQLNRSIYLSETTDHDEYSSNPNNFLRYVAGMDISFVKDEKLACSGLFVFDLSENMSLVYQDLDTELITMDQPYAPGFLAYREAPFLLKKLNKLREEKPELYPQCIFIDGNGVLHAKKFGMACHIGYFSNTPTIGVSKKLYQVLGLENNKEHKDRIKAELKKAGDYFELRSNEIEPDLLGYTYRSTDLAPNPVYVSIGNKISWSTCLWMLGLVIKNFRVPEPIRQADLITREFLRKQDLNK